jgi:catechol-2,3-dioxygenase
MKPVLARIVLYVRDAASLAEWYRDVLGLTTKYDGLDEGWIELDAGGACTLALHTLDVSKPSHTEIAFVVDDVEATRQDLARGHFKT